MRKEEATPRRSKLRGWWGILALIVVLLVAAVGLGLLWYHSDGDLRAVREEAKTLGIPATWSELGLTRSPPEVLARYERLMALAKSLPDYDSLAITGKILRNGKNAPRLTAYAAIPQEARDHHAGLDQAIVAEFLLLLDQLPDDLLILREDRTRSDVGTDLVSNRPIARYLKERVLLATADDVAGETERLLRFIEYQDCRAMIEFMVQISLVEICLHSIAGRLKELHQRMPTLADRLEHLSQRLERQLTDALTGEFLLANHACENIAETRKAMGSFTSTSLWDDVLFRFEARAGRAPLLRHQMNWIQMARLRPTPTNLVMNAQRLNREAQELSHWFPSDRLPLQIIGSIAHVLNLTAKTHLRMHVMIAELRGGAWPIDAFDPAGKPLRRYVRDGSVIGAYTVDEDGIDHGGDKKKDRYFPLYGPLEPPIPATE